MPKAEYAMTS